jgi:Icc-related predicted phosphoesterase
VYGDTRFTDPKDTEAANPVVRQALVKAIANAHPEFVCFGGDIAYNGNKAEDWKVYDSETKIWTDDHIPVYPALGNHDLHGDESVALANYFARFPELKQNRYYSVDVGSLRLIVLDSSLDETTGAQGVWIKDQLDHLGADVRFVAFLMHHPPYTSSADDKKFGGGHSARMPEHAFAKMLEQRQPHLAAKIVVFGGHVHNYERHEHGGVTYFVTGGGGAHAYPIERAPDDPFQSNEINYHYLMVDVANGSMNITMHRLQLQDGKETWSEPDHVTLTPAAVAVGAH